MHITPGLKFEKAAKKENYIIGWFIIKVNPFKWNHFLTKIV